MSPRLSVLVVSFNTRDLTRTCLASLVAHTREPDLELIVVDNASSDGSAAAIAESAPGATLLALDENLGFGAANNLAAEHASGEYLLLLNPDTELTGDAVDSLLAFAERTPDAGIWGGRTTFADGSPNPTSCWGAPTAWSAACLALGLARAFPRSALFHPEGHPGAHLDREREVAIVSGCFLLIRRSLWETLGGFHPAFFMYGEDADLCLRAARLGARPRVTPDASLIHHGGASERVRADKLVRLFTAKAQLFARFLAPRRARFACFTLSVWALVRCAVLGILRRPSRTTWGEVWRRRGEWRAAFAATQAIPRRSRVLAVASGGGHWIQLRRLAPALADCEVVYVTVHAGHTAEVAPARLHVVRDANQWSKFGLLVLAAQVLWIVLRERPARVVSTGAAPGFFAIAFGKLFGARTLWLDSIANARELSLCGRHAHRFADVWLTQWPELAQDDGPEHAGAVL